MEKTHCLMQMSYLQGSIKHCDFEGAWKIWKSVKFRNKFEKKFFFGPQREKVRIYPIPTFLACSFLLGKPIMTKNRRDYFLENLNFSGKIQIKFSNKATLSTFLTHVCGKAEMGMGKNGTWRTSCLKTFPSRKNGKLKWSNLWMRRWQRSGLNFGREVPNMTGRASLLPRASSSDFDLRSKSKVSSATGTHPAVFPRATKYHWFLVPGALLLKCREQEVAKPERRRQRKKKPVLEDRPLRAVHANR